MCRRCCTQVVSCLLPLFFSVLFVLFSIAFLLGYFAFFIKLVHINVRTHTHTHKPFVMCKQAANSCYDSLIMIDIRIYHSFWLRPTWSHENASNHETKPMCMLMQTLVQCHIKSLVSISSLLDERANELETRRTRFMFHLNTFARERVYSNRLIFKYVSYTYQNTNHFATPITKYLPTWALFSNQHRFGTFCFCFFLYAYTQVNRYLERERK